MRGQAVPPGPARSAQAAAEADAALAAVLERCARREPEARAELERLCGERLRTMLTRTLADRGLAETVLPAALDAAWGDAAGFDPGREAATDWVFGQARRCARSAVLAGEGRPLRRPGAAARARAPAPHPAAPLRAAPHDPAPRPPGRRRRAGLRLLAGLIVLLIVGGAVALAGGTAIDVLRAVLAPAPPPAAPAPPGPPVMEVLVPPVASPAPGLAQPPTVEPALPPEPAPAAEPVIEPEPAPVPGAGGRVFIHHREDSAVDAAAARRLAARLAQEGFAVAAIRPVPFRIGTGSVRYFFAPDQALARQLVEVADLLLGQGGPSGMRGPVDFTHYEPKPSPGTVEIWLPSR